ncbi:MAG: cobalamin biosynthesis protein [Treponema sp.]|nr:cobalamin biosynthesis protein [Treponema sp.]
MQFFLYFQLFRLPVAFLLDALFGDPVCIPHPVVLFGRLISRLEKLFRRLFPKTRWGERFAGALLVFVLCACAYAVPILVLYALFSLGLRHGNMLLLTCAYGLDLFWGWQ